MDRGSIHRFFAWGGLLVLLTLHLDFWRPQRPELYFGWMPEDLAYRLVWMLFAWLYLLYFAKFIWKEDS